MSTVSCDIQTNIDTVVNKHYRIASKRQLCGFARTKGKVLGDENMHASIVLMVMMTTQK